MSDPSELAGSIRGHDIQADPRFEIARHRVPMIQDVNLYDGHYGQLATNPQVAVRRETYDEDLGQASWITLAEAREFFRALDLAPGRTALEVACGSGGVTCNERLLAESGFILREVRDVTEPVASASRKWRDARAERRDALAKLEGEEGFEDLQRFLDAVHTLASERRLSRFMYLASKTLRKDGTS